MLLSKYLDQDCGFLEVSDGRRDALRADMGKLRPAGYFILARWHLQQLNSHRELSGRPFFPFEIMDGSDFQKNKPQRCKFEIKNEVKTFYFGDHIRT